MNLDQDRKAFIEELVELCRKHNVEVDEDPDFESECGHYVPGVFMFYSKNKTEAGLSWYVDMEAVFDVMKGSE